MSTNKIRELKTEFINLVRSIFDNPEQIKNIITKNNLSLDDAKKILSHILDLNANECICCRTFDQKKLKLAPIDSELESLLSIVQKQYNEKLRY